MSKSFRFAFLLSISSSFFLALMPAMAWAQHGGGGHGGGGGFHGGGGGGFHGGGGHFGGGNYHGGGGYGGGYHGGGYAPRSGGNNSYRPSGSSNYRGGGNPYYEGGHGSAATPGRSSSPAIADGQWHSFGGSRGATARSTPGGSVNSPGAHTGPREPAAADGAWHGFSGSRVSPSANGAFQAGTRFSSSGFHSSQGTSGNFLFSRFGAAHAGFGLSGVGGTGQLRGGWNGRGWNGSGWRRGNFGFDRFRGFGWNYGWGWGGWGWGLGWGGWGWGFGYLDPCWNDWYFAPGWAWDDPGCYGYSYFDPYIGYYPAYDDSANSEDSSNYSSPAESSPTYDQNSSPANNGQPSDDSTDAGRSDPNNNGHIILIFLKNGAEFDASSYWFENGRLHYTLAEGGEVAISEDLVDLQHTIEQNARRGIFFNSNESPSGPPQGAATD